MKIEQRITRAKSLLRKQAIDKGNPELWLLIWDEMRSANFRLAIILGSHGILVALLIALLLRLFSGD